MSALVYQQQQQYTYNEQYDDYYSSDEEYDSDFLDLQDQLEYKMNGGYRSSSSASAIGGSNKSVLSTSSSSQQPTKKQQSTNVVKNSKSSSISNTTIVKSIFRHVEQNNEQDVDDGSKKQKEKQVSNHLSALQVQEILDKETKESKKKRLPSSEEVYNRIKWEAPTYGIDVDSFTICYSDRFVDLIKVKFSAFEIGIIPLHRVMKVYYQDKIIWDRKDRLFEFPFFG